MAIKEVSFSTEQKIITSVTHFIYKDIQHKYILIPSEMLQYYAHLSAVSLLDKLSWWIQNPQYPPKKLSEIIYVASFEGLHKIVKTFPVAFNLQLIIEFLCSFLPGTIASTIKQK